MQTEFENCSAQLDGMSTGHQSVRPSSVTSATFEKIGVPQSTRKGGQADSAKLIWLAEGPTLTILESHDSALVGKWTLSLPNFDSAQIHCVTDFNMGKRGTWFLVSALLTRNAEIRSTQQPILALIDPLRPSVPVTWKTIAQVVTTLARNPANKGASSQRPDTVICGTAVGEIFEICIPTADLIAEPAIVVRDRPGNAVTSIRVVEDKGICVVGYADGRVQVRSLKDRKGSWKLLHEERHSGRVMHMALQVAPTPNDNVEEEKKDQQEEIEMDSEQELIQKGSYLLCVCYANESQDSDVRFYRLIPVNHDWKLEIVDLENPRIGPGRVTSVCFLDIANVQRVVLLLTLSSGPFSRVWTVELDIDSKTIFPVEYALNPLDSPVDRELLSVECLEGSVSDSMPLCCNKLVSVSSNARRRSLSFSVQVLWSDRLQQVHFTSAQKSFLQIFAHYAPYALYPDFVSLGQAEATTGATLTVKILSKVGLVEHDASLKRPDSDTVTDIRDSVADLHNLCSMCLRLGLTSSITHYLTEEVSHEGQTSLLHPDPKTLIEWLETVFWIDLPDLDDLLSGSVDTGILKSASNNLDSTLNKLAGILRIVDTFIKIPRQYSQRLDKIKEQVVLMSNFCELQRWFIRKQVEKSVHLWTEFSSFLEQNTLADKYMERSRQKGMCFKASPTLARLHEQKGLMFDEMASLVDMKSFLGPFPCLGQTGKPAKNFLYMTIKGKDATNTAEQKRLLLYYALVGFDLTRLLSDRSHFPADFPSTLWAQSFGAFFRISLPFREVLAALWCLDQLTFSTKKQPSDERFVKWAMELLAGHEDVFKEEWGQAVVITLYAAGFFQEALTVSIRADITSLYSSAQLHSMHTILLLQNHLVQEAFAYQRGVCQGKSARNKHTILSNFFSWFFSCGQASALFALPLCRDEEAHLFQFLLREPEETECGDKMIDEKETHDLTHPSIEKKFNLLLLFLMRRKRLSEARDYYNQFIKEKKPISNMVADLLKMHNDALPNDILTKPCKERTQHLLSNQLKLDPSSHSNTAASSLAQPSKDTRDSRHSEVSETTKPVLEQQTVHALPWKLLVTPSKAPNFGSSLPDPGFWSPNRTATLLKPKQPVEADASAAVTTFNRFSNAASLSNLSPGTPIRSVAYTPTPATTQPQFAPPPKSSSYLTSNLSSTIVPTGDSSQSFQQPFQTPRNDTLSFSRIGQQQDAKDADVEPQPNLQHNTTNTTVHEDQTPSEDGRNVRRSLRVRKTPGATPAPANSSLRRSSRKPPASSSSISRSSKKPPASVQRRITRSMTSK
eukprot:CAMPEP_0175126240 /NCGR_PEP_ID=MMETSP0087-20121206/3740_1 /TAXON_ID=136419 /ORGANISM="Unknown Unknown, Strain D1" /LENGTH=1296 /DNA_ID=CAMNT_0016408123 /DNA_START=1 /DNA_END=3891 /DNA_ORIENTATION=+